MENLRRIREPLAWALLAVAAASIVWTAAQALFYTEWAEDPSMMFWLAGLRVLPFDLAFAMVAAAWACAAEPVVRRGRGIAAVGAVITTFAVLATGIQIVVAWRGLTEFVQLVGVYGTSALDLFLVAVAAIALWALALPAAAPTPALEEEQQDDAPLTGDDPSPEDRSTTVWSPTEAVGTVWRTADDAAAGNPGSTTFPPADPEDAATWRPPAD